MKQGTKEWHEARRGKITGTGFAKVMSTRGNARIDYMRELLLERKTGKTIGGDFTNEAMEWGTATEPQARKAYEITNHVKVEQVGFIDHPQAMYRGYVGISPDGLVGKDGGLEIKCPFKKHLEYVSKNRVPPEYFWQVQGSLWVTGRKWWDFVSFDPRIEKEPYFCIRVERDEAIMRKIGDTVDKFIQDLVDMQRVSKTGIDPQEILDKTSGCSDEEWEKRKKEIDKKLQQVVEGKVRHGVVCALIQAGKQVRKKRVKELVDFIITGE
jgi:putative phage-type endonuclease